MTFTVLGGAGFIGRYLTEHLRSQGYSVHAPGRGEDIPRGHPLGHVIFCIGLTADFRERPLATIDAHVNTLTRLMASTRFDSWLYLSTTRVYAGLGAAAIGAEEADLRVRPSADAIYDLSKLLGEAYCLASENPCVRVARLSNVYGRGQSPTTFLGAVIDELRRNGRVCIREDALSAKDYVAVQDVVTLLTRVSLGGRHRLYNVASGTQTTHASIAETLHRLTGGDVAFAAHGIRRVFPRVCIERIREEFEFTPRRLIDDLPDLI